MNMPQKLISDQSRVSPEMSVLSRGCLGATYSSDVVSVL